MSETRPAIWAACAVAFLSGSGAAQTSPSPPAGKADVAPKSQLTVELNKLENDATGGCRAFFLFRNETGFGFEGFEMSLAIIDAAGVIDRLLSIDAAPLPAARTTLKLFEIPEINCEEVSEVLLHEIPSCRPQNADEMDCYPILDLSSRAPAALVR